MPEFTCQCFSLNSSVARKSFTTRGLSALTTYLLMLCSRASCLASARAGSNSPDQALKYCTSERLRLTIQRSVPYTPRTSSTNSWRTWSTPGRTALRYSSVARRSASRSSLSYSLVSCWSLESADEDTVKSLLVRLPPCRRVPYRRLRPPFRSRQTRASVRQGFDERLIGQSS